MRTLSSGEIPNHPKMTSEAQDEADPAVGDACVQNAYIKALPPTCRRTRVSLQCSGSEVWTVAVFNVARLLVVWVGLAAARAGDLVYVPRRFPQLRQHRVDSAKTSNQPPEPDADTIDTRGTAIQPLAWTSCRPSPATSPRWCRSETALRQAPPPTR